jgi:hypothetical protein
MKAHSSFLLLLTASLCSPQLAIADLSGPETEAVYGGRVNAIESIATSASTSRVFVATESANSLFYADVDHSTTPVSYSDFVSVPDVDSDDDYGPSIREIAADPASETLYFAHESGVYHVTTAASSLTLVESGYAGALEVYEGVLYYTMGAELHFGTIDSADGSFSESADSPLVLALSGDGLDLQVGSNGTDMVLYLLDAGTSTPLYICSDPFDAMSSGSFFNALLTDGLTDVEDFRAFGVGPDGRVFLGKSVHNEPDHEKEIAWLAPDSTAWEGFAIGVGGTSGHEVRCGSDPADYYVYFGTAKSDAKGETGSWDNIGIDGFETHANDGSVMVDALDDAIIYMTTDQGIGSSTTFGSIIFEIDNGLEAVIVQGLEMDSDKNIAWVASKSGIRQVTDYQTTPTWSNAMFPQGDGSPYHSIAMDTTDHTGNTVYAGNTRVYTSTDGGAAWNRTFDATQAPYNLDFFSWVQALTVDPSSPNRVAAGYYSQHEEHKGQLFFSEDNGATFDIISGGAIPSDGADFNDAIFVDEGDSTRVLYAAMDYTYSMGFGTSYAVCRIEGSIASGWSVTQDMPYSVSIKDLALDTSGGLYACGCDVGNHPNIYYKPAGGSWGSLGGNGLPSTEGPATAICAGDDGFGNEIPYIAVGKSIYYKSLGASTWTNAHDYPEGTQVNVLYYDDLLVGTGTGLYGHATIASTTVPTATNCGYDCGQIMDFDAFAADLPALICEDEDQNALTLRWYKDGDLVCESDVEDNQCLTLCADPTGWDADAFTLWYELSDGINTINTEGSDCSWDFDEVALTDGQQPVVFALKQNYPNPFNPTTTIQFSLPAEAATQLQVFNLSGQLVSSLVNKTLPAGKHHVTWFSHENPSGVYFYQLTTPFGEDVRKMILLH